MNSIISVIIPLFNKASFISKTLSSVALQTYKEYEVIIIDDGSTDNSYALVLDWMREHRARIYVDRWRCFKRENRGVGYTRNEGVRMAAGKFICFLDADDRWEEDYLETFYKLSIDFPTISIYASNYLYYKLGRNRQGATNIIDKKGDAIKSAGIGFIDYPASYVKGTGMPFYTCSVMIEKEAFIQLGGFNENLRIGEDFMFFAKMYCHYEILYINRMLTVYNNDIALNARATGILHSPDHNFLFCLDRLLEEIQNYPAENIEAWEVLFDKLRIEGLLSYYVDERYHDIAVKELQKVNWGRQSAKSSLVYQCPPFLLKLFIFAKWVGSQVKTTFIRIKLSLRL